MSLKFLRELATLPQQKEFRLHGDSEKGSVSCTFIYKTIVASNF